MDLKELKKLADTLDDNGKQELIYFLQSRIKGMALPVRAIDEIQEQKHKDGLVCPYCKNHSVVRSGKYAVRTCTGEVKRQRYRCKSCRQTFNELTNPLCNERGDLLCGFLDSKEYENTALNKKMLVKSFTVTETNTKLRLSAYSC